MAGKKRQKRVVEGVDPLIIEENAYGDKNLEIFAKRLNDLLVEKQISQQDLALKTELSVGVVSNYCTGKNLPKSSELIKILNIFNVSADYLLGITDTATLNENVQMIAEYTGLNEKAIEQLHRKLEIPKMGKGITDNLYVIEAINFLLSNADNFPILKLIGEYLFDNYKPLYDETYTLEEIEEESINGVWETVKLSEKVDGEVLINLMEDNIWVENAILSNDDISIIEPILLEDLKSAIIVRMNQKMDKAREYVRNDKKELERIAEQARRIRKKRMQITKNHDETSK